LVLDQKIIPEFLQEDCTADKLANSIHGLLKEEGIKQVNSLKEVATILGQGAERPEIRAAKSVLRVIDRKTEVANDNS